MIFEFGTLSSILKAAHLNIIYMYHILKKSIRFTKLNLPIGTYIFFFYIKYLFTMNLFQCDLTWASCDSSMVHTYFYFHFFFSLAISVLFRVLRLQRAINLNIVSHLARYKMTNVLGRLRFGHP